MTQSEELNHYTNHEFKHDGQYDLQQPFRSVCWCGLDRKHEIHIVKYPKGLLGQLIDDIMEARLDFETSALWSFLVKSYSIKIESQATSSAKEEERDIISKMITTESFTSSSTGFDTLARIEDYLSHQEQEQK